MDPDRVESPSSAHPRSRARDHAGTVVLSGGLFAATIGMLRERDGETLMLGGLVVGLLGAVLVFWRLVRTGD